MSLAPLCIQMACSLTAGDVALLREVAKEVQLLEEFRVEVPMTLTAVDIQQLKFELPARTHAIKHAPATADDPQQP